MKCFEKNEEQAECMETCLVGIHLDDPMDQRTPWSCQVLERPKGDWLPGLRATHFWDCNGAGCDSTILQPFVQSRYVAAPQYAPADPADFGGARYGERLWLTGAASDDLADFLGPAATCCGDDRHSLGCGRCLLVRNPGAAQADWAAVVMKKSRCPPSSKGCETGKFHMDIAVP